MPGTKGQKEGIRSPKTGVRDSCNHVGAQTQVLFTIEPPLQSLDFFFYYYYYMEKKARESMNSVTSPICLYRPLLMVSSLDLLKNSNTLPKAVTGNQAIMENQCSFPGGGPVQELNCLETVNEAWLFFKIAFSFPSSSGWE